MAQKYFTTSDYIIVAAIFVLSTIIGLIPKYLKKCNQKNLDLLKKETSSITNDEETINLESKETINVETKETINLETKIKDKSRLNEYLVGNRNIKSVPVGLSILATVFSTNAILGLTNEVYEYGIQITLLTIPITLGAFLSGFVFFPLIRNLEILTIYEYFELRYKSPFIRVVSALTYLVFSILWSGITIYSTSTSLSVATGIPVYKCSFAITAITILYTTVSGIRGVIWCDVFHLVIMFSGVIYVIVRGSLLVGGFHQVWKLAAIGGRLNFIDISTSPFLRQSLWSILFGGSTRWILQYCTEQTIVQRLFSTNSIRAARLAIVIDMIGSILFYNLCAFIGLVVYANYANCDPLKATHITGVKNPNQLFAYFVNDKLNTVPGVSGFIQGTLIAATLSTVSSLFNSQGAVLWNDCLKQFSYFKRYSDRKSTSCTKGLVVLCGCLSSSVTIFLASTKYINIIQTVISISNVFKPPIGLLFILGIGCYFVNRVGAILGFITCLGVGLWLYIGSVIENPQYLKLATNGQCYKSFIVTNSSFNNEYFLSSEARNITGFNKIYSVSYQLLSVVGVLPGFVVAIIASLLSGGCESKRKSYSFKISFSC